MDVVAQTEALFRIGISNTLSAKLILKTKTTAEFPVGNLVWGLRR